MKPANNLYVRRLLIAFSATLACLTSIPAVAVEVIVDRFDDGDRTNVVDGINWFTHSHPNTALGITVVDDSAGLGSGNALRVEPITTGQSIMGVFGSPVSVPAAIGSKLTLRFEMRNDFSGLVPATFRFGLYDARINPTLGGGEEEPFPNPTGFGGMDGDWDSSQPGSRYDPGVYVQQDNGDACCGLLSSTRLREETGRFGTQFGGGDEFNVAAPPTASTFPFLNQSNGKNILTLEVERLAPGTDGGALRYTYTINNGTETGSLSGDKRGDIDPLTSDKYDYFSLFYDGTDTDGDGVFAQWLIDNVTINVTTPGGLSGDHNTDGKVDAADYVTWRNDPATFGGSQGYTDWRANFGAMSGGSGAGLIGGAVPEPSSMLMFSLVMGGWLTALRRR